MISDASPDDVRALRNQLEAASHFTITWLLLIAVWLESPNYPALTSPGALDTTR
jgi:hypothetical protein